MTAGYNTLYAVALFLALCFLLTWTHRRNKIARSRRRNSISVFLSQHGLNPNGE
jgi:hypothetical protein